MQLQGIHHITAICEALRLPPQHEHMRDQLERTVTPLVNPRAKLTQT